LLEASENRESHTVLDRRSPVNQPRQLFSQTLAGLEIAASSRPLSRRGELSYRCLPPGQRPRRKIRLPQFSPKIRESPANSPASNTYAVRSSSRP
jgi:hypothetical protein